MKQIFMIIIVLFSLPSMTQNFVYYPFPETNASWNIAGDVFTPPGPPVYFNYSINFTGDTVIGGLNYHKLNTPYVQIGDQKIYSGSQVGYRGAIRQDTTTRKVFIIPPIETVEQLLYDFTLEVGDTVRGFLEPEWQYKDVVESIDSIMVGSNYHKRWKINSLYNIYLIEGIGSTYGLVEHSPGNIADLEGFDIKCFQQNGFTLYPDTITNCDLITSAPSVYQESNQVRIYPNPSRGSFMIDLTILTGVEKIILSDITGRVYRMEKPSNDKTIQVDNIPVGTYILTIIGSGKNSIYRKVIICP